MGIHINPSILSADFANLQAELENISTADAAHIDVMDNHFVPNLTWGLPVVKRLREVSPVPFDVHLMIEDPDRWAPQYAQVGCESVTFHAEAATAPIKLARTLPKIRRAAEAVAGSETPVVVQVDGGVTQESIVRAAEAGATCFVAGSSVYGAQDPQQAIASLRERATRAYAKTWGACGCG